MESKATSKIRSKTEVSRRSFLAGSTAGAGAAFQIIRPELVRGAGKEKLRAGIVGCGGRGTKGVAEMITGAPNIELVAMADLFEDALEKSLRRLRDSDEFEPQVKQNIKVDPEHRFVGFDAYKKLIHSDIDIVLLHTPPGWRPPHFIEAVEAGKHIFAEKPLGTDPVGVRKVMEAAKKAAAKKLTVQIGAQRRSQQEYVQTVEKIQNGAIGDIVATYANWLSGPVIKGADRLADNIGNEDNLAWQHRAWYSYVWICGDQIVEQHLHNIDVINWVMGTHPQSVVASGGVAWRPRDMIYGNIYDHIYADFEYANGVRMTSHCRQFPDRQSRRVNEVVIGTKGKSDCTDLGQKSDISPYVHEHTNMVNSILGDGPYINNAMAVAESTMTAIMGREAAYSGIEVTWDMIMNSKLDLMPKRFDLEGDHEVPALPKPGEYKFT